MPSALLWAYSAENLFYNCNSGKSADFPELLFHRWGRRGKQHLQRRFLRKRGAVEGLPVCFQHAEPSQAHIRSPAPPKGELFAVTAQFPDKMQALRLRQKLPLSGELANPKDLTERVYLRVYFFFCCSCSLRSSRMRFFSLLTWGHGQLKPSLALHQRVSG